MDSANTLDPDLAAIVAGMNAGNVPSPFSVPIQEARERMHKAVRAARERFGLPEVASIEDCVARHDNTSVPVRVYRPRAMCDWQVPTVVFFHGGGFALGSVDLMDDIARKLCRDLDAVVVSVDYRLAPEHTFPAAHDDALAATLWVLANVSALGGDPARVAVAGESAGANLAASTAITMRDRGLQLIAQLLVVPGVDFARDIHVLEKDGKSYPMLAPADLRAVARLYLGEGLSHAAESPPSPLRCGDLGRVAPAVIALAGFDPLHDEGLRYASRLEESGVPVKVLRFEDMFHQFFGFFEMSAAARRANDEICGTFRALLLSGVKR
jgi:acetyl esterase